MVLHAVGGHDRDQALWEARETPQRCRRLTRHGGARPCNEKRDPQTLSPRVRRTGKAIDAPRHWLPSTRLNSPFDDLGDAPAECACLAENTPCCRSAKGRTTWSMAFLRMSASNREGVTRT